MQAKPKDAEEMMYLKLFYDGIPLDPQIGIPTWADYVFPKIVRDDDAAFSIYDFIEGEHVSFMNRGVAKGTQELILDAHSNELRKTRMRLGEPWGDKTGEGMDPCPHVDSLLYSYTHSEIAAAFSSEAWENGSIVESATAVELRDTVGLRTIHKQGTHVFKNLYSQAVYDSALSLRASMSDDADEGGERDFCVECGGRHASTAGEAHVVDLSSVPLELALSMVDEEEVIERTRRLWFDLAQVAEKDQLIEEEQSFATERGRIIGVVPPEKNEDSNPEKPGLLENIVRLWRRDKRKRKS